MSLKYLLVIFSMLFVMVGCNGNGVNNCLTPEDLLGSGCPSEDLLRVCERFLCGTGLEPDGMGPIADFFLPASPDCIAFDCQTVDCSNVGFKVYTDIGIDNEGLPFGVIEDSDTPFVCF